MSDTDQCARCGGDCPMSSCPECGGCENTGTQPCPACQPQAIDREMRPCHICDYEREECGACDGTGDDGYGSWGCLSCGGTGEVTLEHCCACGGSPYCTCCSKCGAECIAECSCPVTVQLAGGGTLALARQPGMTGQAVRYEPPRRPWHPVRAVRVAALPQAGAAGYLMCAPHWYRLPAGLRARIWATYRPGQTAATASPEYLDALREALGYAAAREVAR